MLSFAQVVEDGEKKRFKNRMLKMVVVAAVGSRYKIVLGSCSIFLLQTTSRSSPSKSSVAQDEAASLLFGPEGDEEFDGEEEEEGEDSRSLSSIARSSASAASPSAASGDRWLRPPPEPPAG